jgi:hypothetical protein
MGTINGGVLVVSTTKKQFFRHLIVFNQLIVKS